MISLVYCGDRNMITGMQLSILSILNHEPEPLDIWVVTATLKSSLPIREQDLQNLRRVLDGHRAKLHLVDVTGPFKRHYPVANANSRFNVNCMLRLFLDYIPDLPERVLYLDTDVLCRESFSNFYHQPLGKNAFAGALDYYGRWVYHHHFTWRGMDYINSGVLLLNMPVIKETGLFKRCRHFCRVHRSFLPDQEALNRYARHKKFVSERYNDQHGIHPKTVFQHFTTRLKFFPRFRAITVKPWDIDRVHAVLQQHDYDALYDQYQQLFRH